MSKNDTLQRFIIGHFLKFKWNILLHISTVILYIAFLTYSPRLLCALKTITRDFSALYHIIYWLLAVAIAYRIYHYVIWVDLLPTLKRNVYIASFEAFLAHKYTYYLQHNTGQLTKYCADISSAVCQLYTCIFDELFVSLVLIIGATFSLTVLPTKYMISIGSWCIIFILLSIATSKMVYRKTMEVFENEAKLNGVVTDIAHNILLVQLFNGHANEKTYLESLAEHNRVIERKLEWMYYTIFSLYNVGFIIITYISARWFSFDYTLGLVTIDDMFCFYNIVFILSSRLWQVTISIQKLNGQLGKLQNAYKIFDELYDCNVAINDKTNEKSANSIVDYQDDMIVENMITIKGKDNHAHTDSIVNNRVLQNANVLNAQKPLYATAPAQECILEFNNISFGHKTQSNLFTNLNIKIKEGEKIGIIGHSGGGKTTFTNLILDLYDDYTGDILLYGRNTHDMSKKELYQNVSIISQQSLLFNRTIKENLTYGNPNATMEEIVRAAKLAQAHDFITSTEYGYDTIIVENGASLSGGQKQRLAIARTILMQTPIVIFDEFTSQLDLVNENIICKEIMETLKDHTLLIIAHRFSTIKNVDRILVFDKGQIAGDGTHAELQNSNDIYKKLKKLGHFED